MTREYTTMGKGGGRYYYKPASTVPDALRKAVTRNVQLAASVLELPMPEIVFIEETTRENSTVNFAGPINTHSRRHRPGGSKRDVRHTIYVNTETLPAVAARDIDRYLEQAAREGRAVSDKVTHSHSYDR